LLYESYKIPRCRQIAESYDLYYGQMDKERRKTLVTVLIEIGKFTTGGLVIGYFVSQRPIGGLTAILGAIFALLCFALAVFVSKEQ
jgi:hypothetical protein